MANLHPRRFATTTPYHVQGSLQSRRVEPRNVTPEYDFVVPEPSKDFFCPVTLELLMEPQQTSCCGNHLSPEASARLQREGKACPMCLKQQWTAALDKYHRRQVHQIRVRCPHKRSGCDWVGELGDHKRHAASCPKRPWECPHCALRLTYGEGEGKHWPACSKFPEPCPNGCGVGSVERCHLEQHLRECPLELVGCEMKEFGCSAVVPRRDLPTHMRESELHHLTAMAVLNLRLTRQLQQDVAEKDEKIALLQLEMTKQKKELKKEIAEQKEELKKEMIEHKDIQMKISKESKDDVAELKTEIIKQNKELKVLCISARNIEMHAVYDVCKVFIFYKYGERKKEESSREQGTSYNDFFFGNDAYGDAFYSYKRGYKFKLGVSYLNDEIEASLYLLTGEYDDKLTWPVKVKVHLELLNQAEDLHHVVTSTTLVRLKKPRGIYSIDDDSLAKYKYADLEKRGDGVQYMMNDCLHFKLSLSVQAM